MKTILRIIVFLFLINSVNAQIVNLPDANFKAKLIQQGVDTNSDGEIQNVEAEAVTSLDLSSSSIMDLAGIESFINLISLDCSYTLQTSLDVSSLTNLLTLQCHNNYQLTSLNVSGLINLQMLHCYNSLLTSLDLSGLTLLQYIACDNNNLTSLDVSGTINLQQLYCFNNQIASLNVNGLTNLQYLECFNNQISSLNVSSLSNLKILNCGGNLLTSLDVSGLTNLQQLGCNSNQLSSLYLGGLNNLQELYCGYNLLTSLDVNNLGNLNALYCEFNQLTSLFVKNGSNLALTFNDNPNLQSICANEYEVNTIQNQVIANGQTATVSSYCSFTPGGNYNTITGSMIFDANSNGCDSSDLPNPNIKININDGTILGSTFTSNSGVYNFFTQAGSFTITPNIENPSWFTFSPTTATIPFADTNNNLVTQNFCISPNGIHNDLEVVIAPLTPAQPGFDATYQITYKNKGNQTLSGNVSLTFDDDITDFVSSNPNPDNLNLNSLSWNYTNLLPFESRVIMLTLNVNSPTETPAVNIGDILHFTTTINPTVADEFPNDNTFNYSQIVVGSFDPNNIECLEGEVVAPSYIGQYLHYAVNFENTGNYPAENIVVKIIIDTTKYDMNSLQLLNVSHNSYTRITGNVVEVIFQQINLDSGGHGNLLFKIRTNDNLVEGNSVAKRADIFFDYNAPIDTGMVNTTFQVLNNSVFELDNSISIYPNPTKGNVTVNCNSTIKSIELYDVQGRLLQTQLLDEVQTTIDISEQSTGIYFLKITSDKGSKVEKIMKE